MKIALQFGSTDLNADPGRVAQEAEARGFEGVFFSEHTHVPLSDSDFPYPEAEDRLEHHKRYHSPLITMAFAAARTSRLTIGTCVGLPAQHDAIALAKALASLDNLSGGRIVYGFGFGWSGAEMADHGVDPKRRAAVTRDKMLAVKALWAEEEPSYQGEFVRFPPCWAWPKPKPGGLPIILGAGPRDVVFDQVIEYCNGWLPSVNDDLTVFAAQVERLRQRAEAAGRAPDSISIECVTQEHSVERLETLRAIGLSRVILTLPLAGMDKVLPALDRFEREYLRVLG